MTKFRQWGQLRVSQCNSIQKELRSKLRTLKEKSWPHHRKDVSKFVWLHLKASHEWCKWSNTELLSAQYIFSTSNVFRRTLVETKLNVVLDKCCASEKFILTNSVRYQIPFFFKSFYQLSAKVVCCKILENYLFFQRK